MHDATTEAADKKQAHRSRLPAARPAGAEVALPSASESAVVQVGSPAFRPANVAALQRTFGNRTAGQMLTGGAGQRVLQRHAEGSELPNKAEQLGEIQEKALPAETRTKTEAKDQQKDATSAGKEFAKAQELSTSAMSLASAQKILQGQFGDVKDIVPGVIVILADQIACSNKYDEVCMAEGFVHDASTLPAELQGQAWAMGDKAKMDAAKNVATQGFEWKGVVYVNGQTSLVTTTAHEVLHANTGAGFRAKMGETFNEGTTELLARRALKSAGIKVPSETAYPVQVGLAEKLENLMGEQTLLKAYFNGPDDLIKKYDALKGTDAFAALKPLAEALDIEASTKAMSTSFKSWWNKE